MHTSDQDQSQMHDPTISCSNKTDRLSAAELHSDGKQPTRAAYTGIATRRSDEAMLSALVL